MELFLMFLGLILVVAGTDTTYYNTYYSFALTDDQYAKFVANKTSVNCTTPVTACNASEPRRINGTCNNLNYPSFGASRTPYYRLLEPSFNRTSETVFDPRLAESGNPLPANRVVRVNLLADGTVPDGQLTSLVLHMSVLYATDSTNTRDTTNYVLWRPQCCTASASSEPMCAANPVAADDRVFRWSGIRCLNMTRPQTYTTSGCTSNTTTPLRIQDATPLIDLSPIYGDVVDNIRRNYTGGNLSVVEVNGRIYPNTTGINLLLGINFFGIIYFWRWHNFIATELAVVNPSWDDEKLFTTAREINIAFGLQIYFYELLPTLMGKDNLIYDGVISNSSGFRDIYNNQTKPEISLEYITILRWMHLMQDGIIRLYDTNGTYVKSYPIVNLTTNINYIKEGNNMEYLFQSCIRQPAAKVDDAIVDPLIAGMGLGGLQRANDITTNDLAKTRLYGFPGYTKYRELCFGDNITSFDDLKGIIRAESIEVLKETYNNVRDIDLLAGVWVEILMDGTYVPPTFYCIVQKQLYHFVVSDRHWYESETRPNAFTADQLAEIRKVTAARMLCDIGDAIAEVQPKAFEVISDE